MVRRPVHREGWGSAEARREASRRTRAHSVRYRRA
jgi:hypothetical protein